MKLEVLDAIVVGSYWKKESLSLCIQSLKFIIGAPSTTVTFDNGKMILNILEKGMAMKESVTSGPNQLDLGSCDARTMARWMEAGGCSRAHAAYAAAKLSPTEVSGVSDDVKRRHHSMHWSPVLNVHLFNNQDGTLLQATATKHGSHARRDKRCAAITNTSHHGLKFVRIFTFLSELWPILTFVWIFSIFEIRLIKSTLNISNQSLSVNQSILFLLN